MPKTQAVTRPVSSPRAGITRPLVQPLVQRVAQTRYRGGSDALLPILMYHRVTPEVDPMQPAVPTAAMLDAQFKALSEVFHVLPLEEAVERLYSGTLPPRSAVITFDDGYRDNYTIALPLLQRHRLTATVFVASGFLDGGRMFNDTVIEAVRRLPMGDIDLAWLGLGHSRVSDMASRHALAMQLASRIKYLEPLQRDQACERLVALADSPLPLDLMMNSEHVRELARHGVSIGGHTRNHPILSKVSCEEALREIRTDRDRLTDLLGTPPLCFAYPNGKPTLDYGLIHADAVRDIGYVAAVSTAVGVATLDAHRYQMPRFVPRERHGLSFVARMLRMAAHTQVAQAT
jgi:peptidoglycan/xylan/chitin deacetylase (PgdA/CDA1 family)